MNIATAFKRSQRKKAEEVADEMRDAMKEDAVELSDLTGVIVDFAELAVARELDLEKEGCYTHMPSKLIPLAYGTKERSKNKQAVFFSQEIAFLQLFARRRTIHSRPARQS